MPSKKKVTVTVSTLDTSTVKDRSNSDRYIVEDYPIEASTTGQQLLEDVIGRVGIKEDWFFGLQYEAHDGYSWLVPHEKVLGQVQLKKTPLHFKLSVKFFPEDVSEEVFLDVTKRYIFTEVRDKIMSGEMHCEKEEAVILAVYYCQAVFGDYEEGKYKAGKLAGKVLPQRIVDQVEITSEKWEKVITPEWKKLTASGKYRFSEDAMLEYLKFAQGVEMYGVEFFPIQNKRGANLLFGIETFGVRVFKENFTPTKTGFRWSEISEMTVHGKKFAIKPTASEKPHVQYAKSSQINKDILHLCVGNRDLYFERRATMSVEVQQIRAKAREEREAREAKAREEEETKLMKKSTTQVQTDDQATSGSTTQVQTDDQATSSFIENLTEDNETVKTLKEALHFYETQVHETNEELTRLKGDKESHKRESFVMVTQLLEQKQKEQEKEAQHSVNVTQTVEDNVTESEVQTQEVTTVPEEEEATKQQEKEKSTKEKVEDSETTEAEGKTGERLDEKLQAITESTSNEENNDAEAAQLKQQAEKEKAKVEEVVDLKATEVHDQTEERSDKNIQAKKESTGNEESKTAEATQLKELAETERAKTGKVEDIKATITQGDRPDERAQAIKKSTTNKESKAAVEETDSPATKVEHDLPVEKVSVSAIAAKIKRLSKTGDETKAIHEETVHTKDKQDREKFKSWKKLQDGSTKARIAMFETM